MIPNQDTPDVNRASGAAVGVIIASLVFIALVAAVKFSIHVPAVDADRAAARAGAFYEIHTNEAALLNTVGWVDQSRGIVRLPIDDAVKIAAQEWQNPAQARADLIARQKQASKPAPAKPAAPNPFE
jgi:O-acetyl-ADP-ribose deacetylase (regulator of RNase III)